MREINYDKPISEQQFCVRWNSHIGSLGTAFPELLAGQLFVDVTLATDGHQLHCHRLVLAACSSYFEQLLIDNSCKHPIIILPRDIRLREVHGLVDFMYKGEVHVSQEGLSSLLKCAEILQIRGLCGAEAALNVQQATQGILEEVLGTSESLPTVTAPTLNQIKDARQQIRVQPRALHPLSSSMPSAAPIYVPAPTASSSLLTAQQQVRPSSSSSILATATEVVTATKPAMAALSPAHNARQKHRTGTATTSSISSNSLAESISIPMATTSRQHLRLAAAAERYAQNNKPKAHSLYKRSSNAPIDDTSSVKTPKIDFPSKMISSTPRDFLQPSKSVQSANHIEVEADKHTKRMSASTSSARSTLSSQENQVVLNHIAAPKTSTVSTQTYFEDFVIPPNMTEMKWSLLKSKKWCLCLGNVEMQVDEQSQESTDEENDEEKFRQGASDEEQLRQEESDDYDDDDDATNLDKELPDIPSSNVLITEPTTLLSTSTATTIYHRDVLVSSAEELLMAAEQIIIKTTPALPLSLSSSPSSSSSPTTAATNAILNDHDYEETGSGSNNTNSNNNDRSDNNQGNSDNDDDDDDENKDDRRIIMNDNGAEKSKDDDNVMENIHKGIIVNNDGNIVDPEDNNNKISNVEYDDDGLYGADINIVELEVAANEKVAVNTPTDDDDNAGDNVDEENDNKDDEESDNKEDDEEKDDEEKDDEEKDKKDDDGDDDGNDGGEDDDKDEADDEDDGGGDTGDKQDRGNNDGDSDNNGHKNDDNDENNDNSAVQKQKNIDPEPIVIESSDDDDDNERVELCKTLENVIEPTHQKYEQHMMEMALPLKKGFKKQLRQQHEKYVMKHQQQNRHHKLELEYLKRIYTEQLEQLDQQYARFTPMTMRNCIQHTEYNLDFQLNHLREQPNIRYQEQLPNIGHQRHQQSNLNQLQQPNFHHQLTQQQPNLDRRFEQQQPNIDHRLEGQQTNPDCQLEQEQPNIGHRLERHQPSPDNRGDRQEINTDHQLDRQQPNVDIHSQQHHLSNIDTLHRPISISPDIDIPMLIEPHKWLEFAENVLLTHQITGSLNDARQQYIPESIQQQTSISNPNHQQQQQHQQQLNQTVSTNNYQLPTIQSAHSLAPAGSSMHTGTRNIRYLNPPYCRVNRPSPYCLRNLHPSVPTPYYGETTEIYKLPMTSALTSVGVTSSSGSANHNASVPIDLTDARNCANRFMNAARNSLGDSQPVIIDSDYDDEYDSVDDAADDLVDNYYCSDTEHRMALDATDRATIPIVSHKCPINNKETTDMCNFDREEAAKDVTYDQIHTRSNNAGECSRSAYNPAGHNNSANGGYSSFGGTICPDSGGSTTAESTSYGYSDSSVSSSATNTITINNARISSNQHSTLINNEQQTADNCNNIYQSMSDNYCIPSPSQVVLRNPRSNQPRTYTHHHLYSA